MINNSKKLIRNYKFCRNLGLTFTQSLIFILYKILDVTFKVSLLNDYVRNSLSGINYGDICLSGVFSRNKIIHNTSCIKNIDNKTFIWFVPHCTNVWGGGHFTIFKFANYFAHTYKIKNIIYLYDFNQNIHESIDKLSLDLKQAFPNCLLELTTNFQTLPDATIALATTWQSAYFVDKFNNCNKKFYFMQDYESLFYAAGTNALQANYTYTFGFLGITGGLWLKKCFESYGGKAQEYIFSADQSIFYPKDQNIELQDIKRIFFYGRPSTERRAFELGMAALELIANTYPNIEIVIAGLDGLHKPSFPCILKGNLSLAETGNLYRTCDIGIALSATNLSYLPVELMASGCPVITNCGPQVEWFCKNNFNALVVSPTPDDILEAVHNLINNVSLRTKLITNGLDTIKQTTWEKEMNKIYNYITTYNVPK